MRRKKSRRSTISKHRKNKDLSPQTLLAMAILVLVVSLLSIGMYMYAFYGNNRMIPSVEIEPIIAEGNNAVSGVATLQIIKRPDDT